MKAKELMLGDWVQCERGIGEVIHIGILYIVILVDGKEVLKKADEVRPRPLTPEILAKNGFEYNDEDAKYADCTWSDGNIMLHLDYNFRIVVTNDFDDESTNRTPFVLRYVHQLQHVYKLLGIDKEITVC